MSSPLIFGFTGFLVEKNLFRGYFERTSTFSFSGGQEICDLSSKEFVENDTDLIQSLDTYDMTSKNILMCFRD